MKLSLVLPTYKKEDIVIDQLDRVYSYLSRINPDFELIFVIDGYVDNTKDILEKYIKENRLYKANVVGYRINKGKGYAVRYGMKRATGDIIGYMDADMDIQIRTLGRAIKEMKKDYINIVIPSKFHIESNVNMKLDRVIFSYGLIFFNKLFLSLPKDVSDVSCGLKLFKRDTIKRILPNLKINRFAIDSEILNEAGRIGYSVSVIPFYLNKNRSDSTSVNIKEISNMIKDILYISNKNRGLLNSKLLNTLSK